MASLSPLPKLMFLDAQGDPMNNGKLYTYAAGTSTPLATYTDAVGGTANANPVILNSRGEAAVWLAGSAYKFVLKDSSDATIWTVDNISAAVDLAGVATISNKTLDNTTTLTIKDSLFTIQDNADTTKQAQFQASGISTATTRTYTLPDASGTLHLDSMATNRILGRTTAGTGAIEEITVGAGLTFGGGTIAVTPTSAASNGTIAASVGTGALTVSLKTLAGADPSAGDPVQISFRSATLTDGVPVSRNVTAATSVTVSSGSTLGTVNNVASRIAVLAIDNAGTVELAVVNVRGGSNLDETGLITTTAEGTIGAADSDRVIYSTTARTSKAYRLLGFVESTQTTAGTWAAAPTKVQSQGGESFQTAIGMWQNEQVFTASGTWTRPAGVDRIFVEVQAAGGNGAAGTDTTTDGSGGGGGGSGEYRSGWIAVSADVTVTVGTTAGSTSTFSSISASGGSAGSAKQGGAGGSGGSGGTLAISGAKGGPGGSGTPGLFSAHGGSGASSRLGNGGGGGPGGLGAGSAGAAGAGYGSGGGGGGGNTGGGGSAGAFAPGIVIVRW
jgi:hypothetical protein